MVMLRVWRCVASCVGVRSAMQEHVDMRTQLQLVHFDWQMVVWGTHGGWTMWLAWRCVARCALV